MKKEKEKKKIPTSEEKEKAHFMKVCKHGVPAGFKCGGCDKVIEIPADAVIKPEEPKEK